MSSDISATPSRQPEPELPRSGCHEGCGRSLGPAATKSARPRPPFGMCLVDPSVMISLEPAAAARAVSACPRAASNRIRATHRRILAIETAHVQHRRSGRRVGSLRAARRCFRKLYREDLDLGDRRLDLGPVGFVGPPGRHPLPREDHRWEDDSPRRVQLHRDPAPQRHLEWMASNVPLEAGPR
jgi:hypothetical protein